MAAAALGQGMGSANAVGPARAGYDVEAAAALGPWTGSANAQGKGQANGDQVPSAKADPRHGLVPMWDR